MIDLLLAVWFQCAGATITANSFYMYPQRYGNNCKMNSKVITKRSELPESVRYDCTIFPVKFLYCNFYGHKWEKLDPCVEEKPWSQPVYYDSCPIEQCFFCKKKRKKKFTEEWEEVK